MTALQIAALALADVLDTIRREVVFSRDPERPSADSHVEGSKANIRNAPDAKSVRANVTNIFSKLIEVDREALTRIEVTDRIRRSLVAALSGGDDQAVRAACGLLSENLGGDAAMYYKTWGKVPG